MISLIKYWYPYIKVTKIIVTFYIIILFFVLVCLLYDVYLIFHKEGLNILLELHNSNKAFLGMELPSVNTFFMSDPNGSDITASSSDNVGSQNNVNDSGGTNSNSHVSNTNSPVSEDNNTQAPGNINSNLPPSNATNANATDANANATDANATDNTDANSNVSDDSDSSNASTGSNVSHSSVLTEREPYRRANLPVEIMPTVTQEYLNSEEFRRHLEAAMNWNPYPVVDGERVYEDNWPPKE
jgi:hypothetical protein